MENMEKPSQNGLKAGESEAKTPRGLAHGMAQLTSKAILLKALVALPGSSELSGSKGESFEATSLAPSAQNNGFRIEIHPKTIENLVFSRRFTTF